MSEAKTATGEEEAGDGEVRGEEPSPAKKEP